MEIKELYTKIEDADIRLDSFLAEKLGLSRSRAAALCDEGYIEVDGKKALKSLKLKPEQKVAAKIPALQEISAMAQDIPIEVVYEDEFILVVNKPKGMVVHPAAGNYDNTLVNALLHHCKGSLSGINGEIRPGIVHRIDKDTSGLLVVAKNDEAHNGLALQMKNHTINREYRAILNGRLKEQKFTVNAPIARHKTHRKKMAVISDGRNAITHFEILEQYQRYTYVRATLETGRTHQIRVHSAHIGHSVLGDTVYGPKKSEFKTNGQCLHAAKLGFNHPVTGEYLEFFRDEPLYFKQLLLKLRNDI